MPGHKITRNTVKNLTLFEKYQCPQCHFLLRDAVQPICGHWMCETCAAAVLASSSPKCPRLDCQEDLLTDPEEGGEYFPDRFVRKEINAMILSCPHRSKGCNWEDSLGKLEAHLKTCDFTSEECPQCGTVLTPEQVEPHKLTCPKAMVKCPLAELGCSHSQVMTREELKQHIHSHELEHLEIICDALKVQHRVRAKVSMTTNDFDDGASAQGGEYVSHTRCGHLVETDGPKGVAEQPIAYSTKLTIHTPENQFDSGFESLGGRLPDDSQLKAAALAKVASKLTATTAQLKGEFESRLTGELRRRDEEIAALRNTISKMEKSMRAKNTELEDRDFRLSLIENSNYDGTIIWKIPQFSQRMSDAQTGKYTSIFSLPFYTGRYGYKMCLRLYTLGDGIGKNSHMSLFFVVMKGEFDNILQWPFTHKVTFKLINQTGGRDIVDTFQPDPMSSSFRKPKSDMNIASGCPRFISHTELKSGGFVVDDTVFIKCSVDCSTIKHP